MSQFQLQFSAAGCLITRLGSQAGSATCQ